MEEKLCRSEVHGEIHSDNLCVSNQTMYIEKKSNLSGNNDKLYHCDTCDKTFSERSQLICHICFHTGDGLYNCNICGKTFCARGKLNRHKRIHTGEKPYYCDICGKTFCGNSNLTSHKCVHTGKKAYHCDICGEKPYHCDICGKTFSQNTHLTSHKRFMSLTAEDQVVNRSNRGCLKVAVD
ncbi:zinc finger protein 2 homolog [Octopus sinensis]|uniref:Zinc finger protein 2 homolog n=1 Tax=Octopus sinensis TaxID=2607531 RepID=A0A6P7SMZ0_9MOLL|nr:zinc finger protein 2 homolog [Octopus sinensis]